MNSSRWCHLLFFITEDGFESDLETRWQQSRSCITGSVAMSWRLSPKTVRVPVPVTLRRSQTWSQPWQPKHCLPNFS